MENIFVRVVGTEALEDLINRSQERPVVIFKHSTTCPVSAAIYNEMERFDGEVALVEVQRARALSREIEKRTGIRHESPQVIVLQKGIVIWNASHWRVTARAVTEAVEQSGR
jgi:monothiol bacilliredoxin